MKIFLASDLHVEFHENFPLPKSPVDLVVLAGDIHAGIEALDVAEKYQKHCDVPVIIICGNHEFYKTEYKKQLAAFRSQAAKLDNVHFLEKDTVIINGIRFLGCTLWTNFALYGDKPKAVSQSHAQQYIADFRTIRFDKRWLTTKQVIELFDNSYQWLEQQLAVPFDGQTIVVTHFLAHRAGIHPMYEQRGFDYLTPYFTSDCSDLIQRFPITAWLHGHTHFSTDMVVENGTRLISNQRGYPFEKWTYTKFDDQKVIEI